MAVPGMTGGDQKPLLKGNAKTSKWHIDDKVVDKVTMLVDLENGESGWVRFAEGVAPDFRLVPMASLVAGGQYPPMPADVDAKGKPLFRRGFRLMVKISDQLAAGKSTVRVVTVDGYREVPGQFGSNYEPIFKILKWIDRPSDLKPDHPQARSQQTHAQEPPSHVVDPIIGEPEIFGEVDDSW
jgi:hypothetical protein